MDVREKSSNGKRLIDANALISYMGECSKESRFRVYYGYAKSFIDNAPTIDAVPVVRCRECKQGEIDDPDFPDEYYCHAGCGWNNGDFYCSYGERKEGSD